MNKVDLLLFLCYFAIERLWKKNARRRGCTDGRGGGSNDRSNNGRGNGGRSKRGASPNRETKPANTQLGETNQRESNGDSSNSKGNHHVTEVAEKHSVSHTHEDSSANQGELCERVRTNAYKYKHFYHKYCMDEAEGGDEEEEGSSSTEENPLLKCPPLRERRIFKVIKGDQQSCEEVAAPPARQNGSDKMRNSNDGRTYTSLYFPSVGDTNSEGGSGNGGDDDEHIASASPSKQKGQSPSEENAHNQLHPCRGALLEGTYVSRGTEMKKVKEMKRGRKKDHCVCVPPHGMKCSHSSHGKDKAVSRYRVTSLEQHIRSALCNVKKQNEILSFINDTYKTIVMMSILSMLVTKGILICSFLYSLQSVPVASGRLFPSGMLPLLQVCHFTLFHLYVREYTEHKRCGP
ncbi:hypothetical protein AK88_02475 [Plasmodium fragile]|uniref:Uncharacterized protein n=1 Tax=Plasmodium fragile TaxID=5857 RepID=A0A0D9QQA1_PLAFR|nr:uncharacterized protein AK88_02475 [Plasmodium fragile]KJP87871.1 hypothetical protein AK88_02475 [Plasmodium fragile]